MSYKLNYRTKHIQIEVLEQSAIRTSTVDDNAVGVRREGQATLCDLLGANTILRRNRTHLLCSTLPCYTYLNVWYLNTVAGYVLGSMTPLFVPLFNSSFLPFILLSVIDISPALLDVAKTIKSILATPLNIFLINTALHARDSYSRGI